jgi:hypothetical protein
MEDVARIAKLLSEKEVPMENRMFFKDGYLYKLDGNAEVVEIIDLSEEE